VVLYNKHTCMEVSPGLDAPRVAGSFGLGRTEGGWKFRETSSHPRCVQSRTHRTCKYMFGFYPINRAIHTFVALRYIRRCFFNIFPAKKITGLSILLYLRLDYLYCIFSLVSLQSQYVSHRKNFFKV
jgi:hypothetical protein